MRDFFSHAVCVCLCACVYTTAQRRRRRILQVQLTHISQKDIGCSLAVCAFLLSFSSFLSCLVSFCSGFDSDSSFGSKVTPWRTHNGQRGGNKKSNILKKTIRILNQSHSRKKRTPHQNQLVKFPILFFALH